MRPGFWLALSLIFLCGTTATLAQASHGGPDFSDDEQAIIVRNQALASAVMVDPSVVRSILDEMAKSSPGNTGQRPSRQRSVLEGESAPQGPLDPVRNPDLDLYMQRASPEAAYDLLQILKRVGAVGGGPKR